MEILNDVEKAAVQKFVEFDTMREAVKKVLLACLYSNGTLQPGQKAEPTINAAFSMVSNNLDASNEQLGADVRAKWEALCFIENAFNKLATYTIKVEDKTPKENKAR